MRRTLVALWLVAAAMTAGAVTVAPAAFAAPANDFVVPTANYNPVCGDGFDSGVCRTDNRTVTYYMDSHDKYRLESPDREDVRKALNLWKNRTDLRISYDSSPTWSGAGETDLIWQEGLVAERYTGYTWCNDPVNGTRYKCDQHYIRIRGRGVYTPPLARHEAGHAFGLVHGQQADPTRNQCAKIMGIMRAYDNCRDWWLGKVVKNNVNYMY